MSNPAPEPPIDFAMFDVVRPSGRQLRSATEKQAIAWKAIDRDAKAAYEKELAELAEEKRKAEEEQRMADDYYVATVSKMIHRLHIKLANRDKFLLMEGLDPWTDRRAKGLLAKIEELAGAVRAMGREVAPPF